MPTKEDLEDAIYKYENSPCNYQTCQSLALFYYLKDKLYPQDSEESKLTSEIQTNSKFGELVQDADLDWVYNCIDELLDALQILNPKLYKSFISKIKEG